MLHWSLFLTVLNCRLREGDHMTLYRCADPRIGWRRTCCRTGKVNPERKRLLLVVPQAVMLHRQAGVRTGGIGRRKSCCRTGNFDPERKIQSARIQVQIQRTPVAIPERVRRHKVSRFMQEKQND